MACDTIWAALGRCAMAARQPLELIILVRIQAPQPDFPACKRGLSRDFQRGLSRDFQRGLFFRKWALRRFADRAGSFYFTLTSIPAGETLWESPRCGEIGGIGRAEPAQYRHIFHYIAAIPREPREK